MLFSGKVLKINKLRVFNRPFPTTLTFHHSRLAPKLAPAFLPPRWLQPCSLQRAARVIVKGFNLFKERGVFFYYYFLRSLGVNINWSLPGKRRKAKHGRIHVLLVLWQMKLVVLYLLRLGSWRIWW